jgi:hypothetical protein
MSIKGLGAVSSKTRLTGLAISSVLVVLAFCAKSPILGENVPQTQRTSSSGHQLVVLLDVNANQRKVLPVELSLAEGVIQKLDQPGNVFSVITFGSQSPVLLKSGVHADEAVAAIRDVSVEQPTEKYSSVRFYDALSLAINQFTDDARRSSLLVISEGNDYFPRKTFKETVARAQQLQVTCNVAMVADHTFYGTKGLQRYGFDLRRFVGKTHGRYIEVGGRQKKVPPSVDRLSGSILAQDRRN